MKRVKTFEEFVNESAINESKIPQEATKLAKEIKGKVIANYDLDGVYDIEADKELQIMYIAVDNDYGEKGEYQIADMDGEDVYIGKDLNKAIAAYKKYKG